MYFTPKLKPLLKAKFKMLKIIIVFHCFPLGKGSFKSESNPHKVVHLLIGGYLLTVLACVLRLLLKRSSGSQKQTKHNATIAKPLAFLEQIMPTILISRYKDCI
jgi:hypothetical protein